MKSLTTSTNSIFCISEDDELWFCPSIEDNFSKIKGINNIFQIVTSSKAVYALQLNGDVYGYKKLPQRNENDEYFSAEQIKFKKIEFEQDSTVKIVKMVVLYKSFFFLTNSGVVYSCGGNDFDQLGLGHNFTVENPVRINSLPFIKEIYGFHFPHVLFVDCNNKGYVSGILGKSTPQKCIDFQDKQIHTTSEIAIKLKSGEVILIGNFHWDEFQGDIREINSFPILKDTFNVYFKFFCKDFFHPSTDIYIDNTSTYEVEINKKSFVSLFIWILAKII